MEDPDDVNEPDEEQEDDFEEEPERKKISLWLIALLGLTPIVIGIFIVVVMAWPSSQSVKNPSTADNITNEADAEVYALLEGFLSEVVEISAIEDNGKIYRIDLKMLVETEDYEQIQTWTDAVCQESHAILESHDTKRDVGVWIGRTNDDGSVTIYGRTYYSLDKDEFEFKNKDELDN